ncbi:transcription initiation factor TFIID subunit 3 [Diaphorina citri]|uniref:Transcription initiation factor TFIID subunit 3 n=1 Tax=Diaphorina citri TaxID=121845 RepID=A0A3Q0IZR9_DIACI|nr:transcription initiation factor TFIID subunit 3 [Diaphorina citri]
MVHVMDGYFKELARNIHQYSDHFGHGTPSMEDVVLAFYEMGILGAELENYMENVTPVLPAIKVPAYPVKKESNLRFLKPGSREVVTRPVHVHEHLPAMYPELEEESYTPIGPENVPDTFKRPSEPLVGNEAKKIKLEEECLPMREVLSVMMTTSGFLSPAREGKLPESRLPVITSDCRSSSPSSHSYPTVPPEVKGEFRKSKKKSLEHRKGSADGQEDVNVQKLISMKETSKLKAFKGLKIPKLGDGHQTKIKSKEHKHHHHHHHHHHHKKDKDREHKKRDMEHKEKDREHKEKDREHKEKEREHKEKDREHKEHKEKDKEKEQKDKELKRGTWIAGPGLIPRLPPMLQHPLIPQPLVHPPGTPPPSKMKDKVSPKDKTSPKEKMSSKEKTSPKEKEYSKVKDVELGVTPMVPNIVKVTSSEDLDKEKPVEKIRKEEKDSEKEKKSKDKDKKLKKEKLKKKKKEKERSSHEKEVIPKLTFKFGTDMEEKTKRESSPKIVIKPVKSPSPPPVAAADEYDTGDSKQVWICPACGVQDDGSLPMIGCDGCDAWYHWVCVGLVAEPETSDWFCPKCSKVDEGSRKEKKKRGRKKKTHQDM